MKELEINCSEGENNKIVKDVVDSVERFIKHFKFDERIAETPSTIEFRCFAINFDGRLFVSPLGVEVKNASGEEAEFIINELTNLIKH